MAPLNRIYGLACILIGGSMAWAGYRILKRYDRPARASGFAGPIVSRSLFITSAGIFLLAIGLILAVIFGLVFFFYGALLIV